MINLTKLTTDYFIVVSNIVRLPPVNFMSLSTNVVMFSQNTALTALSWIEVYVGSRVGRLSE